MLVGGEKCTISDYESRALPLSYRPDKSLIYKSLWIIMMCKQSRLLLP